MGGTDCDCDWLIHSWAWWRQQQDKLVLSTSLVIVCMHECNAMQCVSVGGSERVQLRYKMGIAPSPKLSTMKIYSIVRRLPSPRAELRLPRCLVGAIQLVSAKAVPVYRVDRAESKSPKKQRITTNGFQNIET